MTDSSIIGQLYQRKMFRIGVGYLAVAWLLWQVVTSTCPTFDCSIGFSRTIFWLLLSGLPVTLVVAWVNWKTAIVVGVVFITGAGIAVMNIGSQPIPIVPIVETDLEPALQVPEETEWDPLPNSVAVLPFDNLSLDPENAFFASGIHDTILNELANIRDVNVIARTTMLQYKDTNKSMGQIASELNVETIMEGSVQYAEGRVLITAQLIDPETNVPLWSNNYNREFAGIFEIQADIATRIAMSLEAELLPEERRIIDRPLTNSADAYTLYLKAMDFVGWDFHPYLQPQRLSALQLHLDQAIQLDPNFALAHATKAVGYAMAIGAAFNPLTSDRSAVDDLASLAREHADRALEIDPATGLAYSAFAAVHRSNWEMQEALDDYQRAYDLSPNDASLINDYMFALVFAGQGDEAINLGERLYELDPFQLRAQGWVFMGAGRLEEALGFLKRYLVSRPVGLVENTDLYIARMEVALGNESQALEYLQQAEELTYQSGSQWLSNDVFLSIRLAFIADLYRLLNIPEKAASTIENFPMGWDPTRLSFLHYAQNFYLSTDENDLAIEAAQNHIVGQSPDSYSLLMIRDNIFGEPIYESPEWIELRKRITFSPP